MKTAIFIFDNITQVVMTPEGDLDKRVLELIEKGTTGTMRGSVYTCQGGWIRFNEGVTERFASSRLSDSQSLIVRIRADDPKPE